MSKSAGAGLLTVGRITGCYGIKGWVRVHSFTEPAENFLALGQWQLRHRDGLRAVDFDRGRMQGKGLVAHIAGVDDRTLAESYKGLDVVVPETALPDLEEGEYYWRQLEGLEVWCTQGEDRVLLGTVDYLIETGANDVLVVRPGAGSVDDRERLIPYLPDDTVTRVDLAQGLMEVDWFLDED